MGHASVQTPQRSADKAAQRADMDKIDREILERAVIMAWSDISHDGKISPERWEAATFGFVEAFGDYTDPLAEHMKDRAMKEATKCGARDTPAGDLDSELMDLFLQAVEKAFWLGLTHGKMIVDSDVGFPYRLFPEMRGMLG